MARPKLTDAITRRLGRSHRRARRGAPYLQGITIFALLPLLTVISRVRIHGRERLPERGGFILAPNHPSVLDAFFAAATVMPRPMGFMGMAELWHKRIPGWILTRMGGFPVVRGTWDGDAFDTAASVIERGRVLVMFPEGGVSPPDGYKEAKSGIGHIAHRAGAVVVPIHLDGPRKLYRWWSWPKIVVTVGEPIVVAPKPDATREEDLATAQLVLEAIKALG